MTMTLTKIRTSPEQYVAESLATESGFDVPALVIALQVAGLLDCDGTDWYVAEGADAEDSYWSVIAQNA